MASSKGTPDRRGFRASQGLLALPRPERKGTVVAPSERDRTPEGRPVRGACAVRCHKVSFVALVFCLFWLGVNGAVLADDGAACRLGTARVLLLEQQGKQAEALIAARELSKQDRMCRPAWLRLAALSAKADDWRATEKALQKALRLKPDNGLRLRLAEAFLAQGKAIWARRSLDALSEPLSEKHQARKQYLLALAAWKQDDANTAQEQFEAIAPDQRAAFPLLNYHLGHLQRLHGERLSARRQLETFLDQENLSDTLRQRAEEELELTYQQAKEPGFSLSATVSPLYDSNVVQEPDGQDTTGGKGPDAFGLGLRGNLAWYPLLKPRHRLGLQAGLYRVFYFSDPADDFSLTNAHWQPSYRLRFDGLGRDQELTVSYLGSVSLLDGGALAEEESLYVYSESHAGQLRWLVDEEEFGQSTLRLQSGRALFRHLGRDNTFLRLIWGQSFFFDKERYKLFVEAQARYEDARRDDYDRLGVGPFLGFSALLPWELSLAASFRYEYLNHLASEAGRTWDDERLDHYLIAGLSLGRSFWDHLDIGLRYDLAKNLSTVDTYDYLRHTITLNLTGRGAW